MNPEQQTQPIQTPQPTQPTAPPPPPAPAMPAQPPVTADAVSPVQPQPPVPNAMPAPTVPPAANYGAPVAGQVPPAQPQFAAAPAGGETPHGWNWGAFWLSWIWGVANKVWWSLLAFVPFVGLVIPFVLGAKGTSAAWEADDRKDVVAFKHRQHTWAVAGWVYAAVCFLIIIPLMMLMVLASYHGVQQKALEVQYQTDQLNQQNQQLQSSATN